MNQVEILVLDFGSQYTQLIARRLREYGVYTEIVPYFEKLEDIKARAPKGIILSGGPASVYEEGAYKPDSGVFSLGVPVLGICYGMQYIADFFGGSVVRAEEQEFGKAVLEILEQNRQDVISNGELLILSKSEASVKFDNLVERLLGIWERGARATHKDLGEDQIAEMYQEMKGHIQNAKKLFVAIYQNNPVGYMAVEKDEITMLFADPDYFGRGIAKSLLRRCIQEVGEMIKVGSIESAMSFYRHLGFEEVIPNPYAQKASSEIVELFGMQIGKQKLKEKLGEMQSSLFEGVKQNSIVWMSHADKVEKIPEGFVELAKSGNTHYCAIADFERKIYAIQYHPEVVHSECGGEMLKNFAVNICGAKTSWNMHNFAESEIAKLREIAKDGKVLCAVSGGVDSSVVATLLYRAIGERVIPVFVDHGLLRADEREAVEEMFRENLGVPLITVDAREIFLGKLKGVRDPEVKRKIIGETFIEVFEAEAKKHNANGEIKFLAQGTLYPDVIESVSVKGPSKTIKSHHNVGGLPDWMKFELIEPLRELFKDEVRALGRELGMPESMLMRHPFPGPGLAIRIMGEVNEEDLELLRKADRIFLQELHSSGYYDKVWQAFCVLLNVKSVGVMGDNRTYDNTICVRAVEALDGMTATFAHLPHDLLERISNRIINEVEGINRVVYDITSKPPGTIEWE